MIKYKIDLYKFEVYIMVVYNMFFFLSVCALRRVLRMWVYKIFLSLSVSFLPWMDFN